MVMFFDLVEIVQCSLLVILNPDDVSAKKTIHAKSISVLSQNLHPNAPRFMLLAFINRLVISMLGSIIPPGYQPCHGIMAMRLNLVPFFDFCQLSTSICPHLDGRHGSCAPSDTLALRCQNLICGWVCCQKNCVYIQCIIYIYIYI